MKINFQAQNVKSACCSCCLFVATAKKGLKEKLANYWELMVCPYEKGFIMIQQLKFASFVIMFKSRVAASKQASKQLREALTRKR